MGERTPRYGGLSSGSARTEQRANEHELVQGIRGCVVGWRLAQREGDERSAQVMGDRILTLCGELETRLRPEPPPPTTTAKE